MEVLYLTALLVSITGMVVIDARWRLFLFRAPLRAVVVLVVGVAFFLAWDLTGIGLGVFFRGSGPFLSGLLLGPELPVEEIFFLVLLCYLTMNAWALALRATSRRR